MKKTAAALVLCASLLLPSSAFAAQPALNINNLFAFRRIEPVNNSGVHGLVDLVQVRGSSGGTRISLVAFGLQPNKQYVSLYYDNHVCNLEPYSADDVIANYSGNRAGTAAVHDLADDDLDEINSVSIRDASNFQLLACADIHP